jgi:hypothetical protein
MDSNDFTPEQARIAAALAQHFYNIYQPQIDSLSNIQQGWMIFIKKFAEEIKHGDERLAAVVRKKDLKTIIMAIIAGIILGVVIGLWLVLLSH